MVERKPFWTSLLALILIFAGPAFAGDDDELNDIYRQFFSAPVDVTEIGKSYGDDVIHVSRPNAAGESMEQLQKFSWVFVKQGGSWKVITDFDATTAPLDLLETMSAEITVD